MQYISLKSKIADALELKYGSSDKFDIDSHIDSTLNETENLRIAEDEFGISFEKEKHKDPKHEIAELSRKQKDIRVHEKPVNAHKGIFKPLSSKIPHYRLFGFDIETTGQHNDFLMGSIVGDGFSKAFWDKDEMIEFLLNSTFYHNSKIFATNLGFDITALMQGTEYMSQMKLLMRGSRIIMSKLPVKSHQDHGGEEAKKNLTFLDTMNFYAFSVKEQGKIVGLPKLDQPPYIAEGRKPREDEKAYVEQYNLNDSEITFRFASFLQDSFNKMGCKMRITAASTAIDLFRRKYLIKRMRQETMEVMDAFVSFYETSSPVVSHT